MQARVKARTRRGRKWRESRGEEGGIAGEIRSLVLIGAKDPTDAIDFRPGWQPRRDKKLRPPPLPDNCQGRRGSGSSGPTPRAATASINRRKPISCRAWCWEFAIIFRLFALLHRKRMAGAFYHKGVCMRHCEIVFIVHPGPKRAGARHGQSAIAPSSPPRTVRSIAWKTGAAANWPTPSRRSTRPITCS